MKTKKTLMLVGGILIVAALGYVIRRQLIIAKNKKYNKCVDDNMQYVIDNNGKGRGIDCSKLRTTNVPEPLFGFIK